MWLPSLTLGIETVVNVTVKGLWLVNDFHRSQFRLLSTHKKKTTRLSAGWLVPFVVFVSWAAIVSVVLGSSRLVFALFKIHCGFAGDEEMIVLFKFCGIAMLVPVWFIYVWWVLVK